MADLFVLGLLGHLFGDYMFQTKAMALRKSEKGWTGLGYCTFHVLVYSLCIALLWGNWNIWIFAAVFIPHWVIDRWSLGGGWLKAIGGRTFEGALASQGPHREFDIAFSCIVYTVVDNTLHLLCLLVVIKFMFLKGA